ncbi:hypothetical protein PoB_000205200 [Plakobranchus ocellatus]|uniref:Uncharacterized protein n=1 Tax=Plakobranchus ocellatus TaxID=259542 RepID=A0AAV3Y0C3_9GAST|nr:hypothetical protein PoB_000205200 [Plakobranchus ocellatus]
MSNKNQILREPAENGPASPQQGDLRLSGPPSGQGAGGGARTRDRRFPAELRADSLATVPPTPPEKLKISNGIGYNENDPSGRELRQHRERSKCTRILTAPRTTQVYENSDNTENDPSVREFRRHRQQSKCSRTSVAPRTTQVYENDTNVRELRQHRERPKCTRISTAP